MCFPWGYKFGLNDSKQKEMPAKILAHSPKQPTEETNTEEALLRTAQTGHHRERRAMECPLWYLIFLISGTKHLAVATQRRVAFGSQFEGIQSARMGEAWQE